MTGADQIPPLLADAKAATVKAAVDMQAAQHTAYAAFLNQLKAGIGDGSFGHADVQGAVNAGYIGTAADAARLTDMVDQRNLATAGQAAAIGRVNEGATTFDPKDAGDQQDVDNCYAAVGGDGAGLLGPSNGKGVNESRRRAIPADAPSGNGGKDRGGPWRR